MTILTRRTFALRAGAITALAAVPLTTASLAHAASEADALYREYVSMLPKLRELGAVCDQAYASIPEWAKPGPAFIDPRGNFVGRVVGHPRDVSIRPAPSVKKLCRLGPADLRAAYDAALKGGGVATADGWVTAADARTWYRGALRALAARRKSRAAEYDRAGVGAKERAYEQHLEEMLCLRDRIEGLPPTLDSAAAVLLLAAINRPKDAYADSLELDALRHIRPSLGGLIREHAELLLRAINEDQMVKLSALPFLHGA